MNKQTKHIVFKKIESEQGLGKLWDFQNRKAKWGSKQQELNKCSGLLKLLPCVSHADQLQDPIILWCLLWIRTLGFPSTEQFSRYFSLPVSRLPHLIVSLTFSAARTSQRKASKSELYILTHQVHTPSPGPSAYHGRVTVVTQALITAVLPSRYSQKHEGVSSTPQWPLRTSSTWRWRNTG